MTRARLSLTAPCLALLLAVGCGDDGGGFYEGDSAGGSGSGATAPASSDGLYEGGDDGADEPSADGGAAEAGEGGQGGEPGQLTAGEWRDLDHWQFWTALMQKPEWSSIVSRWQFAPQQRYPVVVESNGAHVVDATVTLLAGEQPLWSARTDVHGEAELFAGMFAAAPAGPYSLKVSAAGQSTVATDLPADGLPFVLPIEAAEAAAKVLDLMFVIDTTGSMGDELSYLQVELVDVIARVREQVGADYKFRVSVNFYRDAGDEYLVRPFPFTEDIEEALADLGKQSADGGGDWPEAVDAALGDAIDEHIWSESAVARLCFIVLDVVQKQRVPPGWVIAVFDSDYNRVARTQGHTVSQPSPSLRALMTRQPNGGTGLTRSLEGHEVHTGYTRLRDAGWTVAVGAPARDIQEALTRSLAWYLGGLAATLLVCMGMARRIADRVTEDIHAVRDSAVQLGNGEPVAEIMAASAGWDVLVVGYHRGGPPGIIEGGSVARRLAHMVPGALMTVPL